MLMQDKLEALGHTRFGLIKDEYDSMRLMRKNKRLTSFCVMREHKNQNEDAQCMIHNAQYRTKNDRRNSGGTLRQKFNLNDIWTGPMDQWTNGIMDQWTNGLMVQ